MLVGEHRGRSPHESDQIILDALNRDSLDVFTSAPLVLLVVGPAKPETGGTLAPIRRGLLVPLDFFRTAAEVSTS